MQIELASGYHHVSLSNFLAVYKIARLNDRKLTLWRAEVPHRPGALAELLDPLAAAGTDLQVVMGYRLPGAEGRAVVEVAPITSRRAALAAGRARLEAGGAPTLQVLGDNRPGLANRIAQALADERFSLYDDGSLDWAPASGPCDHEGVPCRRTPLIQSGVVSGFYYDLQTAALAGVSSTGNGRRSLDSLPSPSTTSLVVSPGSTSKSGFVSRARPPGSSPLSRAKSTITRSQEPAALRMFAGVSCVSPGVTTTGNICASSFYELHACVEIGGKVPPGMYEYRLITPRGNFAGRFHVSPIKSIREVEPNNDVATAQKIALPATIDGLIDELTLWNRALTKTEMQQIKSGTFTQDAHLVGISLTCKF